MQSYSEIECAFITESFPVEGFLSVCKCLKEKGFDLNFQSPGYVSGEDFEYPEWTSLEQACEQIRNGDYESFGINLCFLNSKGVAFNKLSLEADTETKSISLKTGEEEFVDPKSRKIKRSELMNFAKLNQELSSQISVKAWKIAQTGFDHDIGGGTFISYIADSGYPLGDIDNTISWYENEYLTRWQ